MPLGTSGSKTTHQIQSNGCNHNLDDEAIHKERIGDLAHEVVHAYQIIHRADEQLRSSVAQCKGYAVEKGH